MNRARKQLLASARLATQQNRQITASHLLDLTNYFTDCRTLSDNPGDSFMLCIGPLFQLLFKTIVFGH